MYFTSLICFFSFMLLFLDYLWKPRLKMPMPNRIPIIGHMLSVSPKPHIQFMSWAEQVGDIYSVHVLGNSFVIVNSYEGIYEALVTKGNDFAGRPHSFRSTFLTKRKDIFFRSISPEWKKLRMFVHTNLKQYGVGIANIEEIALQVAKNLNDSVIHDSVNGVLDPRENIYLSIINTLSSICCGHTYSVNDKMFMNWVNMEKNILRGSSFYGKGKLLDIFPPLRYFGSDHFKHLCMGLQYLDMIYCDLKEMFNSQKCENNLKLSGLAAEVMKELEKKGQSDLSEIIDDHVAKVVLADIFVAGTATSVSSIYSFLLIIASHPEIQDKIYSEICLQLNKHGKEQISLSDRNEMPYTRACLLEQQRYCSIVPAGVPHMAMKDTSLQNIHIPKHTHVIMNLWALHHNSAYWEKPWEFYPQHFLDEDGDLVPADHVNRKRLLAFSAGPRVCLGESLATARLFIFITSIINKFEIKPAENEKVQFDPRTYTYANVLSPIGCKLQFTERN